MPLNAQIPLQGNQRLDFGGIQRGIQAIGEGRRQRVLDMRNQSAVAENQRRYEVEEGRKQAAHDVSTLGPSWKRFATKDPGTMGQTWPQYSQWAISQGASIPPEMANNPLTPETARYMQNFTNQYDAQQQAKAGSKQFGARWMQKADGTWVQGSRAPGDTELIPGTVKGEIVKGKVKKTKWTDPEGTDWWIDEFGNRTLIGKGLEPEIAKSELGRKWTETQLKQAKEVRDQEKWILKKAQEADKKIRRAEGKGIAGQTVVEDLGRTINILSEHEDQFIPSAAGFAGKLMTAIPESDANVVKKHIESVKSNISIDRLQAMREASPTGGALGQVPVQQQEYLMSLLGSLDQFQKPDVLKDNAKRIFNIYMDIVHGYGSGPERFTLTFDELGRPAPQGRKWSNVWMNKAGGIIQKPSTKTDAINPKKGKAKSDDDILNEVFK